MQGARMLDVLMRDAPLSGDSGSWLADAGLLFGPALSLVMTLEGERT